MKEHNGSDRTLQFIVLGMNAAKRRESYQWLLQRKQENTALFFLSDAYALEAISLYSDLGVSIPQDIGIVGFDDISYAEVSVPKLTTV
ncbi:substrate-binding domain-containing protein, partial [Acinetobacter sp. 163]|nr:substrate-binding domain-containing protein [Acinetobacter sp. 163]